MGWVLASCWHSPQGGIAVQNMGWPQQHTWEVGEATLAAGLPPASGLCTGVAAVMPRGLKALCAYAEPCALPPPCRLPEPWGDMGPMLEVLPA